MRNQLIFVALLVLALVSCGKLDRNGALDGQWQLMEIQRRSAMADTAVYDEIIDTKHQGIYWRFQLDLLLIHTVAEKLNGYTYDTTARFLYKSRKLKITQTYINWHNRDSLLSDPETTTLYHIGIDGNSDEFDIERLSSRQMILRDEDKRLVFRKF